MVVVTEQKDTSDRNQYTHLSQFFKCSLVSCKIKAINAFSWLIARY